MKKSLKVIDVIIVVIIGVIVLDTIQAKLFNNSPLLKIREYYNGGNVEDGTNIDYVDSGIFVKAYQYGKENKKVIFRWENMDDLDSDEIPNGYIAVFHSDSNEIVYETYIYKIMNGHANYGFNYVNVTKTSIPSGKYNIKITKHGSVQWTDNVFDIAEQNNAYSYVTLPDSDKIYSIEEYQKLFLMN